MATVNFIIRTKKRGTLARVYVRFKNGREIDYRLPTEIYMYPEYWNNKSQSFSKRIVYTDRFTPLDKANYENGLRDLKNHILKSLNGKNQIDKELIAGIIHDYHHPGRALHGMNLNQFIAQYLEDITLGDRLTDNNRRFQNNTIRTIRAFKKQFDLFQEEMNKKLDFEDIDLEFYEAFMRYFIKRNYSPNTIGKYIRYLKRVMRIAMAEGLHSNIAFERREFKSPRIEVENIYLTEKELTILLNLDLSSNALLDRVRDVFLIGCYTAQRYSDFSRIRKEFIHTIDKGFEVIQLIQRKTGEKVIIPIKPELKKLLQKYDYNIPKTGEYEINKHIKIIGRIAKIDHPVLVEKVRGGRRVEEEHKTYQLIVTHTARRSGCTNMYLAGIPTIDIMKISGHRSEREFLKYIKVTKLETAQNLARHSYFAG